MSLFSSYIQENLTPGETILYQTKVHWYVYLPATVPFILAFVVHENKFLSIAFMMVALMLILKSYIYTQSSEFAVTNMRIIAKWGWISRTSVELRHDKVESVMMDQSITGRLLGFGTVLLHGTGSGITPLRDIDNPLAFRKAALEAIEAKK